MPEDKIVDTVRSQDIYRQYAMALMACNVFAFDKYTPCDTLNNAQQQLSVLGGIANRYLITRIGEGTDTESVNERDIVDKLIANAKDFIDIKIATKSKKTTNYDPIKKNVMNIIDEYDRLLLKHGIFK